MGDDPIRGVTVEGVGMVVPGAENVIHERSQATENVMTQQMDGTSGLQTEPELGSIADVGDSKDSFDEKGK